MKIFIYSHFYLAFPNLAAHLDILILAFLNLRIVSFLISKESTLKFIGRRISGRYNFQADIRHIYYLQSVFP